MHTILHTILAKRFYQPAVLAVWFAFQLTTALASPIITEPDSSEVDDNKSCSNVVRGGTIASDQSACGPFDPAMITSRSYPSGGRGKLEFIWYSSQKNVPFSEGHPDWQLVPNSNGPTLDPTWVTQTTWYVRRSKRAKCENWSGLSNRVKLEVSPLPKMRTYTTDATCYDFQDGSAKVFVSSPGTFEYAWSNGANTPELTEVKAGTYTVTVTTDKGCIGIAEAKVIQPEQLDVSTVATNVTCKDMSNGNIEATVTGGVAPYDFSWSNKATRLFNPNLEAGDYVLTVTDARKCVVITNAIVYEPAPLHVDISSVITGPGLTASLDARPRGGKSPYKYAWSTGSDQPKIDQFTGKEVKVKLTDANDCATTAIARFGANGEILKVEQQEAQVSLTKAEETSEERQVLDPNAEAELVPWIYPVPAELGQKITIELRGLSDSEHEQVNIQVYDMEHGRLMLQKLHQAKDGEKVAELVAADRFKSGSYIVNMVVDRGKIIRETFVIN